ncbi:MAG: hypothetical protein M3Y45_10610, partial [Actinomycetota bacterium]|nr:hypothetical protein [Actinomycetota bacterium]
RGAPAFHPGGVGLQADFTPAGTSSWPWPGTATRPAVVRISRGIGLPQGAPDLFGFAIRIPDAFGNGQHQDLLLTSGSARPRLKHLLLPSRGFGDRAFTSLAPYELNGKRVVILAVPEVTRPPLDLPALADTDMSGIRIHIGAAASGEAWKQLGDVRLGRKLPPGEDENIGFDPSNTGGGLELTGIINRLRLPAYAGSRSGRGLPASAPGV